MAEFFEQPDACKMRTGMLVFANCLKKCAAIFKDGVWVHMTLLKAIKHLSPNPAALQGRHTLWHFLRIPFVPHGDDYFDADFRSLLAYIDLKSNFHPRYPL